jgi:hypothetical protein
MTAGPAEPNPTIARDEHTNDGADKADSAHKQDNPRPATLNRRERFVSFLRSTRGNPGYFFTACVAALTLAYVYISFYQLRELYQSNERAQRAWVLVENAGHIDLGPDVDVLFQPTLKNFGQSPALQVTFYSKAVIDQHPPGQFRVEMHAGPVEKSRSLLGPGHARLNKAEPYRLTRADYDLIITNKTHILYFVGAVTYSDAFSNDRLTTFCLYNRPLFNDLIYCPNGNDAR